MELNEVIEKIKEELDLIDSTLTNVKKAREAIAIAVNAHNWIDKDLLNQNNIISFCQPIKEYLRNLIDADSLEPDKLTSRYNGLIKAGRGDMNRQFAEGIEPINTITGFYNGNKFEYYARSALSLSSKEWRKGKFQNETSKSKRKATSFDYDQYIQITETLLTSDDWRNLAVGLIASTGRRPHEIFTGDIFDVNRDRPYHLIFSGQGKKKKDSTVAFDIGCLYPAAFLKQVFEEMRNDNSVITKINEAESLAKNEVETDDEYKLKITRNEKLDDKFNHILNDVIKQQYSFLPIPEKLKNKLNYPTCTVLRRACATIIVSRDCDRDDIRQCENHFGKFLGHEIGEKTVTSEYLDYKLIDKVEFLPAPDIELKKNKTI